MQIRIEKFLKSNNNNNNNNNNKENDYNKRKTDETIEK